MIHPIEVYNDLGYVDLRNLFTKDERCNRSTYKK
jgi:hypothetical protein